MTILLNLWTIINGFFLYPLVSKPKLSKQPKVSLLVPLRNEAGNVPGLLGSLKQITYENIEFILLDDHSEDDTFALLEKEVGSDARFRIMKGKELPPDWNGKVHACHQLSEKASGEYLVFLDADARVAPRIIEKTIATMDKHQADMISGFPFYPNHHFLSHMLVPLQHMVVQLHLPLMVANHSTRPMFTAACGIFICIERSTYDQIGGHKSVQNSLVEDVHIAREVKKQGHKMILANITPSVLSYMYDSSRETWEGFKKNIYTGIGRSVWMVLFLTVFYAFVFLVPFGYLLIGVVENDIVYLLPYLLTVTFKMYVDSRTGHPLWLSFFVPLSIVLLIAMMFTSMSVHLKGKSYQWKGRSYE
ncbi:glycosyltransferase [Halobacillus litoralis]|uniref:glycosyltransferase n=1 Tax=Halobacillus litoralis TaxID=45668 RepID=UPI001CD34E7A|nr:glycosyltransferase [Halobacillus litoralis]MCA0969477.1 glycosyltransferase [Halobacillus litoralis]